MQVHQLAWTVVLVLTACGSKASDSPSDAGDASDSGTADAPGSAIDPATEGSFAVAMETAPIPGSAANRTVNATVFTPTPLLAPAPLIVISPGFQMSRTQYASYAHHLASWGFVIILADYADSSFFADHQQAANDVVAVVDWALASAALSIDPMKIGVAGHSLGGKISMLAASGDPRIKAVVGWDPVDSSSPSVAPQLMQSVAAAVAVIGETTNASGGGMPCAPAAENFQQFYAAAMSPALQMTMLGADHMDWVDDPNCGLCGFCAAGTLMPSITRTASRRIDVAWFKRHLLGDGTMDAWLLNPPEVSASQAQVVSK